MSLIYAVKIGLAIRSNNVGTQKIDGLPLKTYKMVVAKNLVQDKDSKDRLFEETFLIANTSIDVILGMLFLNLNNADINFWEAKKFIFKVLCCCRSSTCYQLDIVDW